MSDSPGPVRVLVVDDHAILRDALGMILTSNGVAVVGSTGDGASAVELAGRLVPDVVVMDLRMPDVDGPTATVRILEANPSVRIVVVSAHAELAWVETAFDAGAHAYVLKDHAYDDLITAIHETLAGRMFVSPRVHGGSALLRARVNDASR